MWHLCKIQLQTCIRIDSEVLRAQKKKKTTNVCIIFNQFEISRSSVYKVKLVFSFCVKHMKKYAYMCTDFVAGVVRHKILLFYFETPGTYGFFLLFFF